MASVKLGCENELELLVGGWQVRLTNLHKLFWPELGITKRDLLQYRSSAASACAIAVSIMCPSACKNSRPYGSRCLLSAAVCDWRASCESLPHGSPIRFQDSRGA